VYERAEDGSFRALGDPAALALEEVKQRVLQVVSDDWASTKELLDRLPDPKPSGGQLREALRGLAEDGTAERDPPASDGDK